MSSVNVDRLVFIGLVCLALAANLAYHFAITH